MALATSEPALARARPRALAAGLLAAAALALALAVAARLGGDTGFPTHPVGVAALLGAGLATALATGAPPLVRATGAGLVAYALLGAGAAVADPGGAGSPAAAALVSLWGAAWVPPLVTTGAAALAARGAPGPGATARRGQGAARPGVALVLGTGALATAATAALQRPVAPFSGLPPAAPQAWVVLGGPLLDLTTAAAGVALLVCAVVLWAGVVGRRRGAERARTTLLALGATAPPVVVAVCLLLAVARDPGGVDPSVGSVGFLVVLAAGCAAGCLAVRAAAGSQPERPALVAARGAAAAVVVVAVLAAGVVVASLLDGAPLLLVVGTVGLLSAAGIEGWRRASGWATVLVEESPPPPGAGDVSAGDVGASVGSDGAGVVAHVAPALAGVAVPDQAPPPVPSGWDDLTRREREVLAVLASGASNATIAEQLGISPRTVEAHLRSVFVRLCLDPRDGANRRVVAARLWLTHGT